MPLFAPAFGAAFGAASSGAIFCCGASCPEAIADEEAASMELVVRPPQRRRRQSLHPSLLVGKAESSSAKSGFGCARQQDPDEDWGWVAPDASQLRDVAAPDVKEGGTWPETAADSSSRPLAGRRSPPTFRGSDAAVDCCRNQAAECGTTARVPEMAESMADGRDDALEQSKCSRLPSTLRATNHLSQTSAARRPSSLPNWCEAIDAKQAPGLESSRELTRLVAARVMRHPAEGCRPRSVASSAAPWKPGESSEVYTQMGMTEASSNYVAIWLNVGEASLVFVLEVLDPDVLDSCLVTDFLSKDLNFMVNLTRQRVSHKDTVGKFFGQKGSSCERGQTHSGVQYVSIQIDLYASWLLRTMLRRVAFQAGNVMELVLIDGPRDGVLGACRVTVDKGFLELIA